MFIDNLQGKSKQFRGLRTSAGKLISNRKGGYERSRSVDEYYGSSRRRLLQDALESETRLAVCELLNGSSTCSLLTETSVPVNKGVYVEECEDFENGIDPRVLVLRYGADGKLSSAHYVGLNESAYLNRR